jgi:hypothetical protein
MITVMLDIEKMPNQSQQQPIFDANIEKVFSDLPTFAAQINATSAGMNAIAAGGGISLAYTFSTSTADADPGPNTLRLSSATQNAATVMRVDLTSGSVDVTAILNSLGDSTSVIKGQVKLIKQTDPSKWLVFHLTSILSPAGYRNFTVVNAGSSAASPFANGDAVLLMFTRTGDKGDLGFDSEFTAIASAATVNLDATVGNFGHMTGSATVTAFTLAQGAHKRVVADGAAVITNNASIIVQGGANYACEAGDILLIEGEGSGVVRVTIDRANGRSLKSAEDLIASYTVGAAVANIDYLTLFSSEYDNYRIEVIGDLGTAASSIYMRLAVAGAVDTGSNYSDGLGGDTTTTVLNPQMAIGVSTTVGGRGGNATILVGGVNSSNRLKTVRSYGIAQNGTAPSWGSRTLNCAYVAPNAVTGFRLYRSLGGDTFAAGTILVYGQRKT